MNRFLRFWNKSLWLMLYITPVLLSGYYFGGKFLRYKLIEALNQQLQVQVDVHSIQFSGFRSFPRLGIAFNKVYVHESLPYYKQPFLSAGEIILEFNPLKLMGEKIEIDRIELTNGSANVYINKQGKTNFDLLKPSESDDSEALDLSLKKVILNNFTLIYKDEGQNNSANFHTNQLLFSGKFGEENFTMKSKGDALFDHLAIDKKQYISGKYCQFDLDLGINSKLNAYHLEKAKFTLDKLQLSVKGDVMMAKEIPDLDLDFDGKNMDVQSLLSLLPNQQKYALRELQSTGKIALTGSIKGRIEDGNLPKIDVVFSMQDVGVFLPEKNFDVRSVQLNGTLNNSNPDRLLALNVELTEFRTENSTLKGHFSAADLSHVELKFQSSGTIDFHELEGLLKSEQPNLTQLFGKLTMDMKGALKFDKEYNLQIEQSTLNGKLNLQDFIYHDDQLGVIDHLFITTTIAGNHLEQLDLKGNIFQNQILFKGDVHHWQTYLSRGDRLQISGSLASQDLNLNKLLNSEESSSSSTEEVNLDLGMDLDLHITTAHFLWNKLKASELSAHLVWEKSDMYFNQFKFLGWGGEVTGKAILKPSPLGFWLTVHANANKVTIENLFKDFDNFGQTEFTPEVIQGKITTEVDLSMKFDKFFNVINDSIKMVSDISIKDGALKNYAPMQSLSKFVQLSDLMNIQFEELKNTVEIKNGVMYIPNMKIRNNAMNLELGGTHTFENYMDYNIRIQISEILAGKSGWIRRKQEQQLQDEAGGGLSAFLHMTGTPDDLKIRYDVKSVKSVIGKEVKTERKRFIEDVKKEIKGESLEKTETNKNRWKE